MRGLAGKGIGFSLLALLCLLSLAGCAPAEKSKAAGLAAREEAALTRLAETILETGRVPEDAAVSGVEAVYFYPPGTVEFATGGWGLVPSSSYYGLHYSPDNAPRTFQGTEMELTADGAGWRWEEPGGNWYYTERVRDHWFYFKMHF